MREDRSAVLDWYLSDFAAGHPTHLLPLSAPDIAFLLADDPLAGLPYPIPRIVAWHALRPHSGAPAISAANAASEHDLASWWVRDMAPRLGVADCLIPERYRALLDVAKADTHRDPAPAAPALVSRRADVQVIGPLHQQSGLGRAARLSVETFRRAGANVVATDFAYGFPSPEVLHPDIDGVATSGQAASALIHLNPNMLPWAFAAGTGEISARRAGYFFWELDRPATCDFLALDLVDEIWTASAFVQKVYQPFFTGVVDHVGLATPPIASPDTPVSRSALRSRLGLQHDSLVFLSVFDGFSYVERKNPLGAVAAFQTAFPSDPNVALVIKTHNRPASGGTGQGAVWREIERACSNDRRIRIIDQTLGHEDVLALMAGADAFVSIHRSEGWGLGVLESMQLGIPVIATGYSGTEDFCTPETAWRLPYKLIPVRPGDYVHAEPQHRWADPDLSAAAAAMLDLRTNPASRMSRITNARDLIARNLSFETVGLRYTRGLERLLATA